MSLINGDKARDNRRRKHVTKMRLKREEMKKQLAASGKQKAK
jgi:hypothetical protein